MAFTNKEQERVYKKQWYQENKERLRKASTLQMRYFREQHKDDPLYQVRKRAERLRSYYKCYIQEREGQAKYRVSNLDQIRAQQRAYYQGHKAKFKERGPILAANRKARLLHATGQYTVEQWYARLKYYGFRCVYCTKELTKATATRDHVIPLARGGANWISNIVPACETCNKSKGARRILPLHLRKYLTAIV